MEKHRGAVPRFEIIGRFNQTNVTSSDLRHDDKKFNFRNKKSRCRKESYVLQGRFFNFIKCTNLVAISLVFRKFHCFIETLQKQRFSLTIRQLTLSIRVTDIFSFTIDIS